MSRPTTTPRGNIAGVKSDKTTGKSTSVTSNRKGTLLRETHYESFLRSPKMAKVVESAINDSIAAFTPISFLGLRMEKLGGYRGFSNVEDIATTSETYSDMIRDVIASITNKASSPSKYIIRDKDKVFNLEIETRATASPGVSGKLLRINLPKYESGTLKALEPNRNVFSVRYNPKSSSGKPAFVFEFAPVNHISFKVPSLPVVYSLMGVLVNLVRLFVNIFSLGKTEMVCFSQLSRNVKDDPDYTDPQIRYDRLFSILSIPIVYSDEKQRYHTALYNDLVTDKITTGRSSIIAIVTDWYSVTRIDYGKLNYVIGLCKNPVILELTEPSLSTKGFLPYGDASGKKEKYLSEVYNDVNRRIENAGGRSYYDPIFLRINSQYEEDLRIETEKKTKNAVNEMEKLSKLAEIPESPEEQQKNLESDPMKVDLTPNTSVIDGNVATVEKMHDVETDQNFDKIPPSTSERVLQVQYHFEPVKLGVGRVVFNTVPYKPESVLEEEERLAKEEQEKLLREKQGKLQKNPTTDVEMKEAQKSGSIGKRGGDNLSDSSLTSEKPREYLNKLPLYSSSIDENGISSVVNTKEYFQNEEKQRYTIFNGDMRRFFDTSRDDYNEVDTKEWKTQYTEQTASELFDLPIEKLEKSILYLSKEKYQEYNEQENSRAIGPIPKDTSLGPFIFWERNVRQLGDAIDFDRSINTYVGYLQKVNPGSNVVNVGGDDDDDVGVDNDDNYDNDGDDETGEVYETHAIFISRLSPNQWISVDLPNELVVSQTKEIVMNGYSKKLESFDDSSRVFYLTDSRYVQTLIIIETFFLQFLSEFKLNPVDVPFEYTKKSRKSDVKVTITLPIYRLEYFLSEPFTANNSNLNAFRLNILQVPEGQPLPKEMVVNTDSIITILLSIVTGMLTIYRTPSGKSDYGDTQGSDTFFGKDQNDVAQIGYSWKTAKSNRENNQLYTVSVSFYTCSYGKHSFKERVVELPSVILSVVVRGGENGYGPHSVTSGNEKDWRNFIDTYTIHHQGFANFIGKPPNDDEISMDSFLTARNSFDIVNSLLIYLPPEKTPNVEIKLMRRRKPVTSLYFGTNKIVRGPISDVPGKGLYEVAITMQYSKFHKMNFLQGKHIATRKGQSQYIKDKMLTLLNNFDMGLLYKEALEFLPDQNTKNDTFFKLLPLTVDSEKMESIKKEIETSKLKLGRSVYNVDQALVFVEANGSNSKLFGIDSKIHLVVYIIFSGRTDDGNIPGYVRNMEKYEGDRIDGISSIYKRGYRIGEIIDEWFYIDPPLTIMNLDPDSDVINEASSIGDGKVVETRSSSVNPINGIEEGVIVTYKTVNDINFPRNIIRIVFEGIFKLKTLVEHRAVQYYDEKMDLDLEIRLDDSSLGKATICEPLIRPIFVDFILGRKIENPRGIAYFNDELDYAGMFTSTIKRKQESGSGIKIWKTKHGIRGGGRSKNETAIVNQKLKTLVTKISEHSMIAKSNTIIVGNNKILSRSKKFDKPNQDGSITFEYKFTPTKPIPEDIKGPFNQAFNEYFVLSNIVSQIGPEYSIRIRRATVNNKTIGDVFKLYKPYWVYVLETETIENPSKYDNPRDVEKLKQLHKDKVGKIFDLNVSVKDVTNESISTNDDDKLREETVESVVTLLKGIRKYYRLIEPGATDNQDKLPENLRGVTLSEGEIEKLFEWKSYMPIVKTTDNPNGIVVYKRKTLSALAKKGNKLDELEVELGKFSLEKTLQNELYTKRNDPQWLQQNAVDFGLADKIVFSEDEREVYNYSDADDDDEIVFFSDAMDVDYNSDDDDLTPTGVKSPEKTVISDNLLEEMTYSEASDLGDFKIKNEPHSPNNLGDSIPYGHSEGKLNILSKRTERPTDSSPITERSRKKSKLIEAFYTMTLTSHPRCGNCLRPAKHYCISCGPICSRKCHRIVPKC